MPTRLYVLDGLEVRLSVCAMVLYIDSKWMEELIDLNEKNDRINDAEEAYSSCYRCLPICNLTNDMEVCLVRSVQIQYELL